MNRDHALTFAAALASIALLSMPASAVEVCDKTCVGSACVKDCVRAERHSREARSRARSSSKSASGVVPM